MSNVLWIIGAGASKHVGMPLLRDFRTFFQEIWDRFPENRNDAELSSVLPAVMSVMDSHTGTDIEQLLLPSSSLAESERNQLKQAIRRAFERRQLGRFAKLITSPTPGIRRKFDAYARLLCCMDDGDVVVSFNYDNALEYVLSCMSGNFDLLNVSELSPNQLSALQSRGRNLWIPRDCQDELRQRLVRYSPAGSFAGGALTFGLGTKAIDLLKIHGSINWFASGDNQIHVGAPLSAARTPLLAYPEPNKPETREPPFSLVMHDAIDSIGQFDRIVILGYSFPRSDSTGHPFVERLTQEMHRKSVLAVDPYPGAGLRAALATSSRALIVDEFFERSFASSKFAGRNLFDYLAAMRRNSI